MEVQAKILEEAKRITKDNNTLSELWDNLHTHGRTEITVKLD
jgi:hypothetical protein